MAAVLERKSSSSLFSETAAQRFRRESQEVWEEINKKEENEEVEVKIKKLSLTERLSQSGTKPVVTTPSRSRDPVKLITPARQPANKESELFPKKVKSKFIKTRPASWEKDFEKEEKEAEPPKPKAEKPTIRRLSERTKLAQARKI